MTKLLIDARSLSGEVVPGWSPLTLYGHDQLTLEPTREIVYKLADKHAERLPVIFDIEPQADGSWSLPRDQDKYIEVVDWWREVRPDLRLGFYSMVPLGSYWAPLVAYYGDNSEVKKWQQLNAQLSRTRDKKGRFTTRGLADVVDFVCPSVYMAYINTDHIGNDHNARWFDYIAPMNVDEAKKFGKQVYPFLSPRVAFDNQVGDANKYVGDDQFRKQIKWCLDNTDGCIVWDYFDLPNAAEVLAKTSAIMREFV